MYECSILVSIWNGGKAVVSLALQGTYLFNYFLQDGEMNMMLQYPILLRIYDVSEEGMVKFDTQSFIEETTTDKFRRIDDGDRTMEIYI
jgi:hypothetical protein